MNTTTESMQTYYDSPALLNNYEIKPDVLKDIFEEAIWKFETSHNGYLIGRAEKVLVKLASNPNTPTVVLKELFQKSLYDFLGHVYFNDKTLDEQLRLRDSYAFLNHHGEILTNLINNPVLPLLLLEDPNLIENWLTTNTLLSFNRYILAATKEGIRLTHFTKLMQHFNLEIILDWVISKNKKARPRY